MNWYVRFIMRHRLWVLVTCAVITLAAGLNITRATFGTSIGQQLLGGRPEYTAYKHLSEDFGNDETIIIGLEDPRFFTPEGLTRLGKAVERVEQLSDVTRCHSVLSAQQVAGDGKTLHIENYGQMVLDQPHRQAEIFANLASDEMSRDIFLSKDHKSTTVLVELTVDPYRPVETLPDLVDSIVSCFVAEGYPQETIHRAGFLAAAAESAKQSINMIITIFPFVAFMLLLTVWLLFRRFWPAALSLVVALVAVAWTMGALVAWSPQVNTLVSLAPPVMMIVAFSDVVHLCSAYLTEIGLRETKEEAILHAVGDVGKACVLTSATTFVGFAALIMVPDNTTQTLGATLALGVGSALLLAVTLTPAILAYLPHPKELRTGAAARSHAVLDRMLDACRQVSWRHPRTVIAGFVVLACASAWSVQHVELDADFSRRFEQSNPMSVDTRWFKEQFAGTNMFEMYISTQEPGGLLDPDRLQAVARVQDALEATEQVDSTVSLVDLVRLVDGGMKGQTGQIPDDRKLLAQYMLLFESSGGEDLERLIDFQRRRMRIDIRIGSNGARATAKAGILARDTAQRMLPPGMEAEVTGVVYLVGYFFDSILAGQTRGLLITSIVVTLMMIMGLKSVRTGLLSMIPNLLPLLCLFGAIGAFMQYVDSDVLLIAIMALGIGVDDTIHFLSRLRLESRRHESQSEALKRTFSYSGRGIMMTTIILVAGFVPCAFNGFALTFMLGTLLPLTLVVALLADVLLVPAMLRLGWIGFKRQ